MLKVQIVTLNSSRAICWLLKNQQIIDGFFLDYEHMIGLLKRNKNIQRMPELLFQHINNVITTVYNIYWHCYIRSTSWLSLSPRSMKNVKMKLTLLLNDTPRRQVSTLDLE